MWRDRSHRPVRGGCGTAALLCPVATQQSDIYIYNYIYIYISNEHSRRPSEPTNQQLLQTSDKYQPLVIAIINYH